MAYRRRFDGGLFQSLTCGRTLWNVHGNGMCSMARVPNLPLTRIRRICLSLPDTIETMTWGQPHFRVGDKIFAGHGEERGTSVFSFKLEMKHAAEIIKLPNFWRAPYVGHKGWVSMDARSVSNWDDVRGLILESYRLIAPKRTLAKLEGETGRRSSMALSPTGMGEAVIRNLQSRTGKNLEQWVRVAKKSRLTDPKELRRWLKADHGLGGTTCWIITDATLRKPGDKPPSESEMVDAQFKGDKAALRPVYDRLIRAAKKLGSDVNIGVRKTQTTLARNHTFAIAKAPTKTRIDLGLRLPGTKPTKRLQSTTAFSDNATHCVALTTPGDVDDQLKKWLKAAYTARG